MRRAMKWFLVSGAIGILVALLLYALGYFSFTRPLVAPLASVLCPEMILGLAEPTSPGGMVLLLSIVLGTNFVLYGVVGLLSCGAWSWFRRRPRIS
jgi:hypothetical protein